MTVVCCQERLARNYHKNKSPLPLTHVRYTLICRLSSAIVWVRIVFRKTVLGDWCFDYLSSGHLQLPSLRRSKTSVTNNSLSEDYSQPDNHTRQLHLPCRCIDWKMLLNGLNIAGSEHSYPYDNWQLHKMEFCMQIHNFLFFNFIPKSQHENGQFLL